ncbi:MAG TPA: dipeptidase [Gemmatimonadales bacterium]|nr:dipeptidase [Gemmatimonadales bacterium]
MSASTLAAQAGTPLERARRILKEAPLIDGHNDVVWEIRTSKTAPFDVDAYDLTTRTPGHTDVERLAAGGVGAQFWSIYVPGDIEGGRFARTQLEEFDLARRMVAKYPAHLSLAVSSADIERAARERKVASLLGMEGGHVIENSLGALRAYYDLGARYMTLTHNVTLDWADAANDTAKHGGLTAFGKEVVREMNRLGMLVDLSHVSPGVMSDALDVAEAPVIFSHSSARALTDVPRNVPDSILRRLPKNGGVVMVTFVPVFVSQELADWDDRAEAARKQFTGDSVQKRAQWQEYRKAHPRPRATLGQVADHIDHVRKVAGVDHVGIGSDFDGTGELPEGLEDVSKYPDLIAELARRGWSDQDLRKLSRGNVLRALRQAEEVAARLQKTRAPSVRTIESLDGPAARLIP